MVLRRIFDDTIVGWFEEFEIQTRASYMRFVLAGKDSFEKSVWVFLYGYIILLGPIIWWFVLSKGDNKKAIQKLCK